MNDQKFVMEENDKADEEAKDGSDADGGRQSRKFSWL